MCTLPSSKLQASSFYTAASPNRKPPKTPIPRTVPSIEIRYRHVIQFLSRWNAAKHLVSPYFRWPFTKENWSSNPHLYFLEASRSRLRHIYFAPARRRIALQMSINRSGRKLVVHHLTSPQAPIRAQGPYSCARDHPA
jgi:hypothetical protein